MSRNVPGRHRAPRRHNAIAEIAGIIRESAPTTKGVAVVAVTGGLIGAFGQSAQADVVASPAVAHASVATAPSVVGPATGTISVGSAASAIGYTVAKPTAKPAPVALTDYVHEAKVKLNKERAAKAKADAQKAAAERAASARTTTTSASRTSSRTAIASTSRDTTAPAPVKTYSAPAPSASGIVGIAQSMFGVPYRWGGTSPNGFDCSGFTQWVYRQAGVSIPRTASAQQRAATRVSNPQPGDLVFFGYPAYHVGIYVSPGRQIDAQRTGTVIGNHSIWTTPSGYGRF